jgi:hypothetical protein
VALFGENTYEVPPCAVCGTVATTDPTTRHDDCTNGSGGAIVCCAGAKLAAISAGSVMEKTRSADSKPSRSMTALYGTVTVSPGSASTVGSLSISNPTAQIGFA